MRPGLLPDHVRSRRTPGPRCSTDARPRGPSTAPGRPASRSARRRRPRTTREAAPSVPTRPYLLASAVTGILAQRLVRTICEQCKEEIATPRALRHLFQGEVPDQIYRGSGCDDCRGTGFRGRQGIFELLVLTDELRNLMHERASEMQLTEVAKRSGMITLRDACMARVADGTTTMERLSGSRWRVATTSQPRRTRPPHPHPSPTSSLANDPASGPTLAASGCPRPGSVESALWRTALAVRSQMG